MIALAVLTAHQAATARQQIRQITASTSRYLVDLQESAAEIPGSAAVQERIAVMNLDYLDRLSLNSGTDLATWQELAAAYGRIGDMLGNPAYENLGDAPAALRAYTRMAEIAQADAEAAASDAPSLTQFGAAELGLAMVLPPDRAQEKAAALERAHSLLSRAVSLNPKDQPSGTYKACTEVQLGDLSRSNGNRTAADDYYKQSIATAQTVVALSPEFETQRWLIEAAGKLAEDQALAGNRTEALATLDVPLRLAQVLDPDAPAASVRLRSNAARAWQTAGLVYALLASSEQPQQREADRGTARMWCERALTEWRKLEQRKEFRPSLQKQMDTASAALAALVQEGKVQ